MKAQIITFLAIALLAASSFAQNTSMAKMSQDDGISSKGVRVSIVKPMLEAGIKFSYQGQSFESKEKLDEAIGLSVGYTSLPVQDLGWTSNLTYMDIKNNGVSVGMMRLDGNLAYAFTSLLNIKGGINISNIVKTESGDTQDYKAGLGLQASLGIQINKMFGIDVGYTQMNQKIESSGATFDLKESGAEIGLTGTF